MVSTEGGETSFQSGVSRVLHLSRTWSWPLAAGSFPRNPGPAGSRRFVHRLLHPGWAESVVQAGILPEAPRLQGAEAEGLASSLSCCCTRRGRRGQRRDVRYKGFESLSKFYPDPKYFSVHIGTGLTGSGELSPGDTDREAGFWVKTVSTLAAKE